MDRSDVVTLWGDTISYNALGVPQHNISKKDVFCKVDSVTRSEFFDAGRNGLNPEYRVTMFYGDYSGESIIEYKGNLYSVYRTYLAKTDIIELYVERKGGTNTVTTTVTTNG